MQSEIETDSTQRAGSLQSYEFVKENSPIVQLATKDP